MTPAALDLLVISDVGGYRSVAFPFAFANLVVDGQVMTMQRLAAHFGATGSADGPHGFVEAPATLEMTGKLNGIFLHDVARSLGLECALLDLESLDDPRLAEAMARRPSCVAISTTWMTSKAEVVALARAVAALDPRAVIVAGGPLVYDSFLLHERIEDPDFDTDSPAADHFFLDPELVAERAVDYFVVDERGEQTLLRLVSALRDDGSAEGLPNLAFLRDGRLRFTRRAPEEGNLDDHIVAWDELDDDIMPVVVPLQLSSGCPYRCRYCSFAPHRRRQRKSRPRIVDELRRLDAVSKVRHIRIVDDAMDRRVMKDFCAAIEEVGLEVPWTSFVRADALDREAVEALRRAGCHTLQLGLEAADDRMLRAMGKKADAAANRRALELLDQAGINVRACFLVGFPGETTETVDRLIDFVSDVPSCGPATFEYAVAPFFLVPLAPIYEPAQRAEHSLEGYMGRWRHATMTSEEAFAQVRRVFVESGGDALWGYTGDAMTPPMEGTAVKKAKLLRQGIQKAILAGRSAAEVEPMWDALRDLFLSSWGASDPDRRRP